MSDGANCGALTLPCPRRVGQPAFDQEWSLDSGTLPCPLDAPRPAVAGLRAETIGETVNQLEIYYFAANE